MTPNTPLITGQAGQTTIAQANIAQSLFTAPTLVKSATVASASGNAGTFLVSYGGAPLLTSLTLPLHPTNPSAVYNLAMVQIKSTTAGDKASWNLIYAP